MTHTATTPLTKTYQVLEAIKNGCTTLSAICAATQLSRREVNAFVYALEKQSRVVANSYSAVRDQQVFQVIKYEADSSRNRQRIHPSKTVIAVKKPTEFVPPAFAVHPLQHFFFQTSPTYGAASYA